MVWRERFEARVSTRHQHRASARTSRERHHEARSGLYGHYEGERAATIDEGVPLQLYQHLSSQVHPAVLISSILRYTSVMRGPALCDHTGLATPCIVRGPSLHRFFSGGG